MIRVFFAIVLSVAFGPVAFTQIRSTEPSTDRVDKLFAQLDKPNSPGCALAVIKDSQIIYKHGYGTANLELSDPITTTTVFNAGSIAKQFTAMSVLMLAQQGKLTLDDDVRKYISEVPDFGTTITLRHLIHHTSGLRDFLEMLEMAGWRTGADVTTEKDILDMVSRQRTLNHPTGEEVAYSNTGYVLLAVVVKRVTGQSLSEFAEVNIFKPLGMNNTRFADDHRALIMGLADGYLPKEGGSFVKWMPTADHAGSSSLYTTVEDLARWDQNFYDKKVGGPALIDQLLIPGTLNDGAKVEYRGGLYAGGLIVTLYKGLKTVIHGGSSLGYQGTLHRFPEQHFSTVLLCNIRGVDPDGLARRVADIYLADQLKQPAAGQGEPIVAPADAVKLSEKELSNVAGLYWNPATDAVRRVYVKGGKLMYFRAPGNESELAPLNERRFLMLGVRNRVDINFQSSRPGDPLKMSIIESGMKPSLWESVKPASKPQTLSEFAGNYFSPEVNATYRIFPQADKLLIHTGNWGDFLLSPRFVDSFANPEEMGSVMFTRDRNNRVSGFVIRSGRVRNLRFIKSKYPSAKHRRLSTTHGPSDSNEPTKLAAAELPRK